MELIEDFEGGESVLLARLHHCIADGIALISVMLSITDGDLLRGVRYDAYGATSQSLVMRVRSGTIRTIDTRHRADRIGQYSSLEFR